MHVTKNLLSSKLSIHWEPMINGAEFKFDGFSMRIQQGLCRSVCVYVCVYKRQRDREIGGKGVGQEGEKKGEREREFRTNECIVNRGI